MSDESKRIIDPESVYPTFNRVLVRVLKSEREDDGIKQNDDGTAVTKSGLLLPPKVADAKKDEKRYEALGEVRAVLVRKGLFAFSETEREIKERSDAGFAVPEEGDDVFLNNYPGMEYYDAEGNLYRLCRDVDITAIIKKG